jgi:PhzF family phenazine biosynthesis protein
MQLVARETRAPATTFAHPDADGYALRWFTTATELEFCGHGTLASAHALWECRAIARDATARFRTSGGLLTAVKRGDWIELDFPSTPPAPSEAPPGLIEALGVVPVFVGRNRFDYLVEVTDQEVVRTLKPDIRCLSTVATRGVIVTSRADSSSVDFVSRFFAPSVGIDEDSVTGSAHCCLAPFWSRRLNKASLIAHQLSERGGVVKATVDGDRVRLAGQAVTVMRGELLA